jgi:AcrR family transcriptional regulator
MDSIAFDAGVTKPVLYQHFCSKRALFRELLQDLGQRLSDAVSQATAEASTPREQVVQGIRAYFTWACDHRGGFEILFAGETRRDAEFAGEVTRAERELVDLVASLIVVEGSDELERSLLAYAIVGLSEGACRFWIGHCRDLDVARVALRVADLAWCGLRGLPGQGDVSGAASTRQPGRCDSSGERADPHSPHHRS